MARIVITGSNSGLGAAMRDSLLLHGHLVHGIDHNMFSDSLPSGCSGLYSHHVVDVCDVNEVNDVANKIGRIDVLINNVGVNCIDYLEDIRCEDWERLMDINARSIFICSQAFLSHLKDDDLSTPSGTIINITSNAAHMPMTSSLVYNASKAAAEIMTKQLARELFPRWGIHVMGIAPNKLSGTGMSEYIDNRVPELRGWTKEKAAEYQLKGLAIGEETPPAAIANFVYHLLGGANFKDNHKYFHGCIIPFGL